MYGYFSTSGSAIPGCEALPFGDGAFNKNYCYPVAAFTDGLSNTVLVGETSRFKNEPANPKPVLVGRLLVHRIFERGCTLGRAGTPIPSPRSTGSCRSRG